MFNVKDLNLTFPQKPRGDRLFVIPLVQARRGQIIDMEENRERPVRGVVIAVSDGGQAPETGRPIVVETEVGELIDFGKYAGLAYELEGPTGPVKVFIMRDAEVLASQAAGTFDLTVHEGNPNKMHLAGLTCEECKHTAVDLIALQEVAYGGGLDPDAPVDPVDQECQRASLIIP